MKIPQQFSKLLSGHYFQTEIFNGHNSLKNVCRVMVLNFCTSPYDALYFGLNNIYSLKNTYVNTTQMVQDLTVSATLIYKSFPETNQKLQYM